MSTKINQLQLLQQNLQAVLTQRQQIQNQLIELESALLALKGATNSYKIMGHIMVSADGEELSKDLSDKKEICDIRLKNFSKQEEKIKVDIETLQKEVVEELKNKK
ncbi:MAG: prefoldin subunit beta [Nanoarchaeota archaeon]|nr:prefoldin subunit beta [Nanoarchaeota archaeon]MBU1643878.1 prefoldin subunit beta [Nanoarchaeota archaeon]MBU1977211.1 prefoldin subunit beta [Nanoarchaeota archaeon]